MKKFITILFFYLSLSYTLHAATGKVNIDTIDNYRGWGWEVLVISNNYITLSIVPAIGGRVLQYDLGTDTFMIVNESLLGQLFYDTYPTPYTGNWGYGGYKTWPAPQSRWNWPPPPTLAWGNYEYEVLHASDDSVTIWLKGQTETTVAPGLRFDRYITAYRNTSRVNVATVLFNDNSSSQSWSIWDVTQTIVRHGSGNDYANFSAYFPAAHASDVWGSGPSYQEILPGIYQAKYVSTEGKISASASEGWVCFVDERDHQSYAKIFDLVDGAEYTHNGASVEIYTNGSIRYMEVEVLGPYQVIGPNGDSIIFIEDWYATRISGAPYSANHGGIIKQKLSYNQNTGLVTGTYGAFHEGEFRIIYLNSEEEIIDVGPVFQVSPDTITVITYTSDLSGSARYIEVHAYNIDGVFIDFIDKIDLQQITDIAIPPSVQNIKNINLYPNPAEEAVYFNFHEKTKNDVFFYIVNAMGQKVNSGIIARGEQTGTIDLKGLEKGVYLIYLPVIDTLISRQIIKL